jgi:hypothetical protein
VISPQFFDRFMAAFRVRNVFDAEYSHPGGFEHLQSAIQQDGRTIGFEITARL